MVELVDAALGLALLIGFVSSLVALAVVILRDFGLVVRKRVLSQRGRLRFRLRTLLLVATVVQGSLALAVWQTNGQPRSIASFLFVAGVDFVFLGIGIWVLWYTFEEFLHLCVRRRSAYRRYRADEAVEMPLAAPSVPKSRPTRWWAKKWPNRYRVLAPGQDYTLPIGRDRF